MEKEVVKLADLDLSAAQALAFRLIREREIAAANLDAVTKRIAELEAE